MNSLILLAVCITGVLAVDSSLCKYTDEYGFGPDPSNCHLYIRCLPLGNNQFTVYSLSCGPKYWNQAHRTCGMVIPDTATCDKSATRRPVVTTKPSTVKTRVDCPFEVNPSNHSQFRHLNSNEPYQTCQDSFEFDLTICTCLLSGGYVPPKDTTHTKSSTTESTTESTTTRYTTTTTRPTSTTTEYLPSITNSLEGDRTTSPISTVTSDPFKTTTTVEPPTCDKSSLIAHFPFERNLNDISCNIHSAKVVKDDATAIVSYDYATRDTQAIHFDGKYIVESTFTNKYFSGKNLNSFSASFFVVIESDETVKLLSRENCQGFTSFYVGYFKKQIRVFLPTSTKMPPKYTFVTLPIDTTSHNSSIHYNHIAFSLHENTLSLYVDGQMKSVKQPGLVSRYNSVTEIDAPLTIGGSCSGNHFKGNFDELLIFKHGLFRADLEAINNEYRTKS